MFSPDDANQNRIKNGQINANPGNRNSSPYQPLSDRYTYRGDKKPIDNKREDDLTENASRADKWVDFRSMIDPNLESTRTTGERLAIFIAQSKPGEEAKAQRQINEFDPEFESGADQPMLQSSPDDMYEILRNEYSPDILRQAVEFGDSVMRCIVATNPHCPADVMIALSTDRVVSVRLAVIRNPKVPVSVLEHLAWDSEKQVADAARAFLVQVFGATMVAARFGQ